MFRQLVRELGLSRRGFNKLKQTFTLKYQQQLERINRNQMRVNRFENNYQIQALGSADRRREIVENLHVKQKQAMSLHES